MSEPIREFWIAAPDDDPPNWGGEPRRCVVERPVTLPGGREGWRVRLLPPLPGVERDPLREAVIVARAVGSALPDMASRPLDVRVCRLFRDAETLDREDLTIEYEAIAASDPAMLPSPLDEEEFWRTTLGRIRRFIEAHGQSRVPDGYVDDDGYGLAGLVGNIRWHHAGRGGESPGPFPGVDYAADLDTLEGWSWATEEPEDLPVLRAGRYEERLIQDLGLAEGIDEARYIEGVTAALRTREDAPWPRLREVLAEAGIEVRTSVLADLFPVRFGSGLLGVVITPDRRSYAFFLNTGDPQRPDRWDPVVRLSGWRELSTPEEQAPYAEQIRLGLRMIEVEQGG